LIAAAAHFHSSGWPLHLVGENAGNGMRQLRRVLVVPVMQRLGQHVRTGERELERPRGELLRARAGNRQIERAGADRPHHHARRPGAEPHA